jgi:Xaa-Pro aminopeptidase
MIVSNEPGFYKQGAYGIRIENLLVVIDIDNQIRINKKMLGFETLTVAPIDLSLVERALLSDEEVAWLNFYHSRVFETHSRKLDRINREWLRHATREI